MVSRTIWRSTRFGTLTAHRDKLAYFYYLTCEHMTATGCYRLPDGYAIADLAWTMEDYLAARAAVLGAGLIDHDPETDEIYVEKWLANNPPRNQKHATGIRNLIYGIESDRLREKLEADFRDAWQPNPLDNHPSHRGGNGLTDTAFFRGGRP
ncbi:MAG: hypothetical protein M9945_12605 [Aquamicrobium sp.]|uniref:hypothetical protein n=1 Tax=Aquamicrobium sp. TaxID=1872579 RepID=UPI00349EF977|nr:hypothetical protein [Aquamicrobium sp.]